MINIEFKYSQSGEEQSGVVKHNVQKHRDKNYLVDFLLEAKQARRQWTNIVKVRKEKLN